jgi:hypothetical protein
MPSFSVLATGQVERTEDGAQIPPDPENRDYQLMLAALRAGSAELEPVESDDPRAAATSAQIETDLAGAGTV